MKNRLSFVLVGIVLGILLTNLLSSPKTSIIQNTIPPVTERLDTLTVLNLPKGNLEIGFYSDKVSFMPFANIVGSFHSFSLTAEQYPELFKQGSANTSFLAAESIEDSKTGNTFVRISNNQPDHGWYSGAYWVKIDPISGRVVSDATNEKTEIISYAQTFVPTKKMTGKCWTTSIATVQNENAYRCIEGNQIYDPCFAIDDKRAVCRVDPEKSESGVTLDLSEPLPTQDRPTTSVRDPWMVKLSNGLRCTIMTGTAGDIGEYSYYYYCDNNSVILNGINQQRNLWEARVGYLSNDYQKLIKTEDVTVTKAWW